MLSKSSTARTLIAALSRKRPHLNNNHRNKIFIQQKGTMAVTPTPATGKSAAQRSAARAAFFSVPNKPLRPIFTFVNGDNCWLVSIPIPASERAANPSSRLYFHFVLDPWLFGRAVYKSTLVLHYTQTIAPEIANVAAIGAEISDIEAAAAKATGQSSGASQGEQQVDAILISDNEAPDHLNKDTLLTFSAEVPIYVDGARTHEVEVWKHFRTVVGLKALDKNNSLSAERPLSSYHPGGPLPRWITFIRLSGAMMPQFSSVIAFESPCEAGAGSDSGKVCHEMILYTPHGHQSDYPPLVNLLESQWPPMRHLALMTPLLYSSTGGVATQPGGLEVLKLERRMRPKFWVPTADSDLNTPYTYGGAISWVLKLVPQSLEKALEDEEKETGKRGETPNFLVVKNGECLILDC